ncbi:MAG TPA: hypothetical protein VKP65_04790 [Rhodothermales bacterium]|nr:hypothetical protein [Rhodothermales bacterium]
MDKPDRSTPPVSHPPKQSAPPGEPDAEESVNPMPTAPRFVSAQLEVEALRAMLDSSSGPAHDSPSTS